MSPDVSVVELMPSTNQLHLEASANAPETVFFLQGGTYRVYTTPGIYLAHPDRHDIKPKSGQWFIGMGQRAAHIVSARRVYPTSDGWIYGIELGIAYGQCKNDALCGFATRVFVNGIDLPWSAMDVIQEPSGLIYQSSLHLHSSNASDVVELSEARPGWDLTYAFVSDGSTPARDVLIKNLLMVYDNTIWNHAMDYLTELSSDVGNGPLYRAWFADPNSTWTFGPEIGTRTRRWAVGRRSRCR